LGRGIHIQSLHGVVGGVEEGHGGQAAQLA